MNRILPKPLPAAIFQPFQLHVVNSVRSRMAIIGYQHSKYRTSTRFLLAKETETSDLRYALGRFELLRQISCCIWVRRGIPIRDHGAHVHSRMVLHDVALAL